MTLDANQIRELYERSAPVVFRRARSILGSERDAWDVVHDVFVKLLKLLEKPDAFREEATLATYVYSVTTNHCLNYIRHRGVARAAHGELVRAADDSAPGPDRAFEARLFLDRLWEHLYDKRLRAVAIYRYIDELPVEEIAQVLDVSTRTVHRDLEKLSETAKRLSAT